MLAYDFFSDSNYLESCVWCLMGMVVLLSGTRLKLKPRGRLLGAVVLVLFGLSDIVEASTGAWWRPWWLLVWKGICVLILLPGGILLLRINKPQNPRDVRRGDSSEIT